MILGEALKVNADIEDQINNYYDEAPINLFYMVNNL